MGPAGESWGRMSREDLFGVVLAGGESRRFGEEKALFPLAGLPMAQWALQALIPWTARQGVVAGNPQIEQALGVPVRGDRIPGKGPLGGLHSALIWAREEGFAGVFVLACDLPLVPPELVGRILSLWPSGAAGVVPESHGPLGLEPLCAAYAVEALPLLETQLRSGDLAMEQGLARLDVHRIPASELGSPPELVSMFMNVNTRDEARRAEEILLGPATPQVAPTDQVVPTDHLAPSDRSGES